MFDNVLVIVILTVIVTAAIMGAGFVVMQRRISNPDEKFADSFVNSWGKIRPILTNLFIDGVTLYDATQGDYNDLEEYAVNWLLYQIDIASFLTPEEKQLLTKERITRLIAPRLKEWYDTKLE
jgi:hypothetical protein